MAENTGISPLAAQTIAEIEADRCNLQREVAGLRSAISTAIGHLTIDDERGAFDVLSKAERKPKTRLGKLQLALLRQLSNPWLFLVTADKVARSLAKRGLIAPRDSYEKGGITHDVMYQITPAGLRVVADLFQAGELEFPMPERKKPGSGTGGGDG